MEGWQLGHDAISPLAAESNTHKHVDAECVLISKTKVLPADVTRSQLLSSLEFRF